MALRQWEGRARREEPGVLTGGTSDPIGPTARPRGIRPGGAGLHDLSSMSIHGIAGMWTVVILVLCWLPAGSSPWKLRHQTVLVPQLRQGGRLRISPIFAFLWMSAGARTADRGIALRVAIAGLALAVVSELGEEYIPYVNRDTIVMDAWPIPSASSRGSAPTGSCPGPPRSRR